MNNSHFSATLFYDGHCAICKKVKKIIQIADFQQKIRLFDLWDASTSVEFQDLDFQKLIKEIHLQDKKGKLYTGYFAFKQVARIVPVFSPFFLLSFLPGIDYLGTKVYKYVSENRYRFGCETCGRLYCKIHLSQHH